MSSSVLQGMVKAYEEHQCSVVGLMEVLKDDISSYGCAGVDPISPNLVEVNSLVEKPSVEDAPSNLAIMGRYLFTPEIFDEIDNTPPGVGGEIQITDAMVRLMTHQRMLGFTFTEGRYDTGKKIDYLRAVVDFALQRDDVGPQFREILADVAKREGLI